MTKPLFTFRDSAPWLALSAVALLVHALVMIYGQDEPVGGIVVFSAAGAMLGLVGLHFWRRWKEVDAWNRAPKLDGTVAVLSPCSLDTVVELDIIPQIVTLKWVEYALTRVGRSYVAGMISGSIDGCDITFRPTPWWVNGVLVGGTQEGPHITVVGPEVAGIERTRALIIHELSHRALTALGIPAGVGGENHHRIFAEEGLGC